MTTQISFTIDADVKKRAAQRAKSEGITLKAFLHYCMSAFADRQLSLGIIPAQQYNYSGLQQTIHETEKNHSTAKNVDDLFSDILG